MTAQVMINRHPAQRLGSTPRSDSFGTGGAQAGLAGGVAMILSAALLAGVNGYDIWFQLKSIASLVLVPAAIAQAWYCSFFLSFVFRSAIEKRTTHTIGSTVLPFVLRLP